MYKNLLIIFTLVPITVNFSGCKDFEDLGEEDILEVLEKNGVGQKSSEVYESRIVNSKDKVIQLSNLGFDCRPIRSNEWLMQKKLLGQLQG